MALNSASSHTYHHRYRMGVIQMLCVYRVTQNLQSISIKMHALCSSGRGQYLLDGSAERRQEQQRSLPFHGSLRCT